MIDLHRYPYFALDTETTGLTYPTNRAFGVSVSTPDGQSEYYDLRNDPQAVDWLNDEVRDYRGTIICHNASFDYKMAYQSGIYLPIDQLDDTVIRAVMIDEHLHSYSLDDLAKKYLGKEKQSEIYTEMADLFGGLPTRNVQMARIAQAPAEVVRPYAIRDTQLTLALWQWQGERIRFDGLSDICEFERSLIPIVIQTEMHGIRVDLDQAAQAMEKLTPRIDTIQQQLNEVAGKEFNSNSTPQIRELFEPTRKNGVWVANDGTTCEETSKGNASINALVLRKMQHPAAKLILELRSVIKTRDTFLGKHILGHQHNGRVYPNINQNRGEDGGTITGRFSYSNPAMQQIPSRNKEVAAIVKPCFLPDEGHVWLDADLNSFEVRIFAHLVNNPVIIQAYKDNPEMDFHQFVADLTNLPRNASYAGEANAKQLNLSMIFNAGKGATADQMGLPWEWDQFEDSSGHTVRYKKPGREAVEVIEKYHRRIRGVHELASGCTKVALTRGYVHTFTGRRLRFPNGYKAYKASGLLIQATSADVNKINWLKIDEALDGRGKMILNTHDSYSMSVPEEHRDSIWKDVKGAVESHDLRVPILLDYNGTGHNWWGALTGELDEATQESAA